MASYPQPNLATFKAGGTIVKGHAVKIGADAKHVIESTATTDKHIGIAMGSASSGDDVEVALPGGGCEVKAKTTFTAGQLLTSESDGLIKKVAAAGDRVVAMALDDAAANDLCPAMVVVSQAYQTES